MILSIRAIAITIILICFSSPAVAQYTTDDSGFYVRPVISYVQFGAGDISGYTSDAISTRTKSEDVVGGIAGLYRHTTGNWSYELEYALRVRTDANAYVYRNEYTQKIRNNIQNHTLMANVVWRLPWKGRFEPYVVAGVGVVRHWSNGDYSDSVDRFEAEELDSYATGLTWTVGAGARFEVRDWQIEIGYRYLNLDEGAPLQFANGLGYSVGMLTSHDIALTFSRVRF